MMRTQAPEIGSPRALPAALLCAVLLAVLPGLQPDRIGSSSGSPGQAAERSFGRLPASFEPNVGQADARADFLARGPGYAGWFNATQAVLEPAAGNGPALRMRLVGADARAEERTEAPRGGVVNYLRGEPENWKTQVPTYGRIAYSEIYPGIDIVYSGAEGDLRYDFVLAPGANPKAISLAFEPAGKVWVDGDELVVESPGGIMRHEAPFAYQETAGGKKLRVEASFEVAYGRASFDLGRYDTSRPLIIDPTTEFATLLGGGGTDGINSVVVGQDGSIYVAGNTNSLGATPFPTQSPLQGANAGGNDAFVTKLNAAGTALVYSTYIGGAAADNARAIAVDGSGAAYVAGDTASTDFPTQGPIQAAKGAGATADAFALKLNPAGSALVYSTYLGGGAADQGFAIDVDGDGSAYVGGATASTNFPTQNPFQAAKGAGTTNDGFVSKLNAAGSALEFSTYLGGGAFEDDTPAASQAADVIRGIAVDDVEAVYVAGDTFSTDFPTQTPIQAQKGPGVFADTFVTKLAADGESLAYSTYLGGDAAENGNDIEIDGTGRAHVVGTSSSNNFPVSSPTFQATRRGEGDATITILDAAGSALDFSTFFGGPSADSGNGIALRNGKTYFAGSTNSATIPTKDPVAYKQGNSDAYLARLDTATRTLEFSSHYGGNSSESGLAVAVDAQGGMYLAGSSVRFAEGDFPAVDALQPDQVAGTDAFLTKFSPDTTGPDVTSISPRSGPRSGGTVVKIRGTNFGGATQVVFGSTPAQQFHVDSPTQVTAISPESAGGTVDVRVVTPLGTSEPDPVAKYLNVDGFFQTTRNMVNHRWVHTSTLLQDGRVLVAGGQVSQGGFVTPTAEVYNPLTETWTATGSLNVARFGHTATLLPDGRVLVAGGFGLGGGTNLQPNLDSAEIWDPATGQWTVTGSLSTAHALHSAVVLDGPQCTGQAQPDWCGDVLVAGGRTWDPNDIPNGNFMFVTPVSELYDVATGEWRLTGELNDRRHTTAVALLDDGRVLIPAGFGHPTASTWNTAELYDPTTGEWTRTGNLTIARSRQGAIKLPDGRVLVVGGFAGGQSGEIWDPDTGQWTLTSIILSTGRFNWYSALLPNGEVLITGGGNGGSHSEIYNVVADQWRRGSVLNVAHGSSSSLGFSQDAMVLSSSPNGFEADPDVCGTNCGKVLVTGNSDDPTNDLYLMAPEVHDVDITQGPRTGGTQVAITGLSLLDRSLRVFFGNDEAEIVSHDWDTALVRTPAHDAGSVPITVRTEAGEAVADDEFEFVQGEPDRHARSVSLELRRHIVAEGRVSVADRVKACRRNVPVLIQRRTASGWETVGRDDTNRRGFFKDGVRDRPGRYRAKVKRLDIDDSNRCLAATSAVRRHRHR